MASSIKIGRSILETITYRTRGNYDDVVVARRSVGVVDSRMEQSVAGNDASVSGGRNDPLLHFRAALAGDV